VDSGEDFCPHLFDRLVINLEQLWADFIEEEDNGAA
jgi:hypothetical protein